ncbi:hypothetical protein MLIT_32930 [Mycolicibacterium litorale]|uniref:IPT/TIG domain-containing protein n=1 Tax=Mycolicibacterium litorale TaxID=758802 RepID=A0AAD1MVZ3_9MYCO|nr:hypothetical protein [Mycolicibacterium litorale]TDY09755.1 hypothetical protein BCL50_1852 [Mycolicibacterium litorale]BBY17701.1 hypothetical protein MLIT_32930 [Mycolicibacterium litorale]
MAESNTLKNVSIVVGIVATLVTTIIAVFQFLDRDGSGGATSSSTDDVTSMVDANAGCGIAAPAEITLSSGQASRGEQVTVYGSCFQPDERVTIRVHATEVGSATADSEGGFTQTITIPDSAPPSGFPTDISATGRSSVKTGTAPFETG